MHGNTHTHAYTGAIIECWFVDLRVARRRVCAYVVSFSSAR